jgi:hypothetical protein
MAGAGQLTLPLANLTLVIPHVEFHDRMRIDEVEIRYDSFEGDYCLRIECGPAMVCLENTRTRKNQCPQGVSH